MWLQVLGGSQVEDANSRNREVKGSATGARIAEEDKTASCRVLGSKKLVPGVARTHIS